MASTINASTTGGGGIVQTADASGVLQLQSNGTTIATISSTGLSTQVGAPAFLATWVGTQTVTSNTVTKVTLNTEQFDTNSNYDPTTNYRFTPTVAGYYQFSYGVNGLANSGTNVAVNAVLYKNGSGVLASFSGASFVYPTAADESNSTGSVLIYMNGTTDYVELYGKVIGTSPRINYGYLSGFLARSA